MNDKLKEKYKEKIKSAEEFVDSYPIQDDIMKPAILALLESIDDKLQELVEKK